jgi:light-regulated signal transduction histidine kinase (bacteriophytochrome)
MMNYTAMRQKKPVIRDSAERKRRSEVLPSSEEHVRASQLRELHMAVEEIGRLKESNTKLRQFIAVISHDLREPLRTISAYAKLLHERYRGKLDEDGDEFLTFITGGTQWMTELISDLLSDPERVTRHTDLSCVDSQELCHSAIRNLKLAIAEAEASINCGPLPKVLANHQLTLVFQNLIGNAIKYRAEARPQIQISAEPDEGAYWRFSVADNGVGFNMAHADKLFSPFYRVDASGECAGTGMGSTDLSRRYPSNWRAHLGTL